MNVRILGCHGSGQLVPCDNRPIQCDICGFLVNDRVRGDAGRVRSRLYLEERLRVRVALLTHLHFDHIRKLPTLIDNRIKQIRVGTGAVECSSFDRA